MKVKYANIQITSEMFREFSININKKDNDPPIVSINRNHNDSSNSELDMPMLKMILTIMENM